MATTVKSAAKTVRAGTVDAAAVATSRSPKIELRLAIGIERIFPPPELRRRHMFANLSLLARAGRSLKQSAASGALAGSRRFDVLRKNSRSARLRGQHGQRDRRLGAVVNLGGDGLPRALLLHCMLIVFAVAVFMMVA